MKLKEMYENNIIPEPEFQQFSSFPTAFVVAADIELSVRNSIPGALRSESYLHII